MAEMNQTHWAVLIGINTYHKSIGSLKYCVNDCRHIEAALIEEGGHFHPANILVLADDEKSSDNLPTYTNIYNSLAVFLAQIEEDDTLFFFFAGHGREINDNPCLIPCDANLGTLHTTGIPVSHVQDRLNRCKASQIVFVIDACHSGAGRDVAAMKEPMLEALSGGEGIYTITSCGRKELSYEWEEMEQGVFSYYLAKALAGECPVDGNGCITADGVYSWVNQNVRKWARSNRCTQTPWRKSNATGEIVLRSGGVPEKKAPSPSLKKKGRPATMAADPDEEKIEEKETEVRARNEWKRGDELMGMDPVTALACYKEALRLWPQSHEAKMKLGQALVSQGKVEEGLEQFDSVVESKSNWPEPRRLRAAAWLELKEYDRAIDDYTALIRISSGTEFDLAEAYSLRAKAYYEKGKALPPPGNEGEFDLALRDLDLAINQKPDDPEFFFFRGTIKDKGKKDLDGAVEDYNEAIRLDPADLSGISIKGLMALGGVYVAKDLFKEAAFVYARLVGIAPRNPGAHNNLGYVRFRLGRYEEAEKDLTRAIELKADYGKAYVNRGHVRQELGWLELAAQDYHQGGKRVGGGVEDV